jgi:hypothetical protein
MSKAKPTQLPFDNKNTYGFMSQDPNNQFVKDYMAAPIEVDPGAGRRTDLAEQGMQNRWNSAFTGDIPQLLKMRNQESERRQIQGQGAAEMQQATYAQQMADLERKRSLLPQMVQTGSSGYQSQLPQSSGFWNSLISGGSTVAAAGIMA